MQKLISNLYVRAAAKTILYFVVVFAAAFGLVYLTDLLSPYVSPLILGLGALMAFLTYMVFRIALEQERYRASKSQK